MNSTVSSRTMSDLGPGNHVCCLFDSDSERHRLAPTFLAHGIQRNQRVLFIIDSHSVDALLKHLREDGIPIDRLTDKGQLVVLTPEEETVDGVLDPDSLVGLLRRETDWAVDAGYSALRVAADMTAIAGAAAVAERVMEYEARLNEFIPDNRCLVICEYDGSRLDTSALLSLLTIHPFVVIGSHVIDSFLHISQDRSSKSDPMRAALNAWLHAIETFRQMQRDLEAARDEIDHQAHELKRTKEQLVRAVRERKSAEQTARENEAKYRDVVEGSKDAILILQDGRLEFVNRTAVDYLGYEAEELTARPLYELVHPEDRGWDIDTRWRSMSVEEGQAPESVRLVAKSGKVHWAQIEAVPTTWDDRPALMVFASDITELKRAEEALKQNEARYRFLVENMHDILWTADLNMKTTYVSPSVERVLGFTPAERRLQSVEQQLTPESLNLARNRLVQALQWEMEHGPTFDRPVSLELDFVRKDGSTVCLETVMGLVRDEKSRPIGVYGLSRDITERKRNERATEDSKQRLAQIIDFLPDATLVIDNEGRVIAWNRAMEDMTGINSEDMVGKGNYEYSIPFYGERVPMLIDLVSRRDEEVEKKYLSFRQEGGTLHAESYHPDFRPGSTYLSGAARALYDLEGNRVGAIETIGDITDRKMTEAALKQAKEAAEAAGRAKSEFLANMSHEIRTPLNAVLGMIELLLDTELTTTQRQRVTVMKSATDTLHSLLNDILDFSRIEAGKLDLDDVDFSLQDTFSSAVSLLGMRARDKNLGLRYFVGQTVPDCLRGDPNRLRQIVLNLANNAIKFTHEGEVVIRVEAEETSAVAVVLHCVVSDTGIGISREKLDTIFDRFSQADSSTTRKYGGTGLGLAISAQLAKAMGGRIWATSQPGKGSEFHFTVRLKQGRSDAAPSVAETQEFRVWPSFAGLHVLLAEDNVFNQAVAVEVLKKLGCDVTVASNGEEAVQAFKSHAFHIVLMDLQMPEMDGFQAAQLMRLHETGSRVPIIAQTAHVFEEDRERCLAAGMDDFITKPVKASQLARVLRNHASLDSAVASQGPAGAGESPAKVEVIGAGKAFDSDELLRRLDGDEEVLREVVALFFAQFKNLAADLGEAATNGNWELVARIAHTLKGSCASMAASEMMNTSNEIQRAAQKADGLRLLQLIARLDAEFEALQQEIRRLGYF